MTYHVKFLTVDVTDTGSNDTCLYLVHLRQLSGGSRNPDFSGECIGKGSSIVSECQSSTVARPLHHRRTANVETSSHVIGGIGVTENYLCRVEHGSGIGLKSLDYGEGIVVDLLEARAEIKSGKLGYRNGLGRCGGIVVACIGVDIVAVGHGIAVGPLLGVFDTDTDYRSAGIGRSHNLACIVAVGKRCLAFGGVADKTAYARKAFDSTGIVAVDERSRVAAGQTSDLIGTK